MNKLISSVRTFATEEDGAQILEYALIVAVISLTLIAAMATDKIGFSGWVTKVKDCLAGAATCKA
jgi:pilus assembly protein Flp/PilA